MKVVDAIHEQVTPTMLFYFTALFKRYREALDRESTLHLNVFDILINKPR